MKKIIFIIFAVISLSVYSYESEEFSYRINGIIKDAPDSSILQLRIDNKVVDSTLIINEKFVLIGKVSEPTYSGISVKGFNGFKACWIENNEMSFTANINNLREAIITGSETQKEADILFKKILPYLNLADSLMKILFQKNIEQNYYDSIKKIRKESFNTIRHINQDFIREYPNSLVSLNNLNYMKKSYGKEVTSELFSLSNRTSKQSKYGKSIARYLKLNKNPQVGDYYIDFEQENINGKKIKLSDIKAKYVLLEFWASWCYPCRQENPNLVKTYLKYKKQGFEILGVSNDSDKNSWVNAIKKDNLTWENVSDLKGGQDDVNSIYGVNSIPSNFLINKKGIIIARDLRGEELDKKLEELLEKQ